MENNTVQNPEIKSDQNQKLSVKANKKKTIMVLLVFMAVAMVIATAIFYYQNKNRNIDTDMISQPVSSDTQPLKPGEVRELSGTQIPQQFPREFLVEPDAQILKNYDSKNLEGQLLGVREYVSTKTVEQNMVSFLTLMQMNGWEKIDRIKQPQMVILTADKGNVYLRVLIEPYLSTNQAKVFISSLAK